jgi:hypothetical protein
MHSGNGNDVTIKRMCAYYCNLYLVSRTVFTGRSLPDTWHPERRLYWHPESLHPADIGA